MVTENVQKPHASKHARYIQIKQKRKNHLARQKKYAADHPVAATVKTLSKFQFSRHQKQLLGLMLLAIIATQIPVSVATQLGPELDGLKTTDITEQAMTCRANRYGGTPGRVCLIADKTFYMKGIVKSETAKKEMFNQKFVKEMMGITVPVSKIFHEKDGVVFYKYGPLAGKKGSANFFIASEAVDGFVSASDANFDYSDMRKIIEKIGETGVANLAVANMFFKDLCPENWGYNQHGLVLIDVDSSPHDLQGYFSLAMDGLDPSNRVTLSLDNLREMRKIYKEMLAKPLPSIDGKTYISKQVYTTVLESYIQASTDAIAVIQTQHASLDSSKHYKCVNDALKNSIRSVSISASRSFCNP